MGIFVRKYCKEKQGVEKLNGCCLFNPRQEILILCVSATTVEVNCGGNEIMNIKYPDLPGIKVLCKCRDTFPILLPALVQITKVFLRH